MTLPSKTWGSVNNLDLNWELPVNTKYPPPKMEDDMPRIKKRLSPIERLEQARFTAQVAELELMVEPIGIRLDIRADESLTSFASRLVEILKKRVNTTTALLARAQQKLKQLEEAEAVPESTELDASDDDDEPGTEVLRANGGPS